MASPEKENAEVEEISGVITRIVYRSEETGYTVCSVEPIKARKPPPPSTTRGLGLGSDARKDQQMTVVGNCSAAWVGENVKATGRWTHHKRHGYQFQAEQLVCVPPVTTEGIRMYLAGGTIKGIGEVMANRLVDHFGKETLRVIEKESKKLEDVPGIGPKTRERIKTSWISQKAVREIMIFMRGHGIGAAQATRIHKQYGDDAVAVVMKNPYRLCRDVWGIGFKSADKIAMSIGIPPESDIRARAGILHVLQVMADDGHCFCPWDVLIEEGQALLNIPAEKLHQAIEYELAGKHLVEEEGNVYLATLHEAELSVASRIARLMKTPPSFKPIDAGKAVPWAEERMGIALAPAQAEALRTSLSEKVTIITGGPGVGKTTIVRAIVDVFNKRRLNVSLAAPTGRAAKRLSESTGATAMTLHRLLKFQPAIRGFEHGPGNPLPGDVFIVDEVSMIDLAMMSHFLGALADESHVVFVGDSDQLPSVGPGNVLKDLINSGTLPCRTLDTIFRQKSRSLIVQNAHRVNHGEALQLPDADDSSDFFFLNTDDPDDVIKRMLQLVSERIPRRFGMDPRRDIQVLTPMRRNQLGADNLNSLLQEALNPSGRHVSKFGRAYRAGDRVMQIRNNYDKEVFNGDIGIVSGIDEEEQSVTVDFDRRPVPYEYGELDELVLAYACSIHKSQGSEYPAVVILMATQHFKLLQRNLLYTAITRGRRLVCLVGSRKAVWIAIRNNRTMLRRTGLAKRLAAR